MQILNQLQQKLLEILRNDEQLKLYGHKVYISIPYDAVYPYISVAETTVQNKNISFGTKMHCKFRLNVFSAQNNNGECWNILCAIKDTLAKYDFSFPDSFVSSVHVGNMSMQQNRQDLSWVGELEAALFVFVN